MSGRMLLLSLAVGLSGLTNAFAGDDPHGQAFNVQCNGCHAGHKAAGGSLTNAASNENVCASCHNLGGSASSFAIENFSIASLAAHSGSSHAWNTPATNANAGAGTPTWGQMSVRLDGGNIICSTCHNQHSIDDAAVTAGQAGTQTKSTVAKIASGGGTGTVAATTAATASAKSYIIEIIEQGGASGSARFRLSNDGGLSWFGYSAGTWVTYSGANAQLTGASVALNDGALVSAQFSGTFAIGDKFRFYVAYPFLRMAKSSGIALDSGSQTTGDKFCRVCHGSWAMDHTAARTYDGNPKSHPVGVALGANGEGYDRVTPLDGDGGAAGSDGNATNDLLLAADGTVQCLSCHGVHHADGNTETVDQP